MKNCVRNTPATNFTKRVLFSLLVVGLSSCFTVAAHAQWKQILPAGVTDYFAQGLGGALEYKAGKLWVGLSKELWMSPDEGATWNKTSLLLQAGEIINDIVFFDAQHGLVAGYDSKLYATDDGGLSWRTIKVKNGQHCFTAAYGLSVQTIIAGFVAFSPVPTLDRSFISISNDGGLTWDDHYETPGGYLTHLQVSATGTIAGLLQNTINGGQLIYSPDNGTNWIPTTGRFDSDSYSFRFDACEVGRLYVINDQIKQPTDPVTNLFYSTDMGSTWPSVALQGGGKQFACGSILAPDHLLLYIQTFSQGILRSTDGGLTWKSIGGPIGMVDSRVITAKDNNTIFAAADDGSIWMTSNSGGDPVPNSTSGGGQATLALSEDSLFVFDTILPCDTKTITHGVRVGIGGCTHPDVKSQIISGPAASDYTVTQLFPLSLTSNDSVKVTFHPSAVGLREAVYELTLVDGRVFKIFLVGVGKPPRPLSLTTITTVVVDTLGDSIAVPITINGMDKQDDVEMTVSYDPIDLQYINTTSNSGVVLDIPGGSGIGFSRIRIPAAEINLSGVSATSHFIVFADSQLAPTVRVDQLVVPDPSISCAYTTDTRTLTTVTIPSGCGIPTISYFLRHHLIPGFSITPNPNTGTFTLSSSLPIGVSAIDIIDELGSVRKSFERELKTNTTIDVSSLPSGVYFIRIKAAGIIKSLPMVLQK